MEVRVEIMRREPHPLARLTQGSLPALLVVPQADSSAQISWEQKWPSTAGHLDTLRSPLAARAEF